MPSITFHGAAGTVTGSRHLLEYGGHKVLVDCGLFQGPREIRDKNWEPFPVDPREVDAVVLTHAHTDHIGFLPKFVKMGYRKKVYATLGTVGLCRVSLPDSGRLQEEEAKFRNRHGATRHSPALPLYTEADAYETLNLMEKLHYYQWQELPGGATFRYLPAGHILGAAFIEFYFPDGERILMGGDLGRYDAPIIKDPTPVDFAEYLVIESTYGNRLHPKGDAKEMLLEVAERAMGDRGIVLVPSFAIGRTQELLWFCNELEKEGRWPGLPIYVDSPMANKATLLYLQSEEDHDNEMRIDMREGHSPFRPDMVRLIQDRQFSKELNSSPGPWMVIAGSGMCTGGRILHHLKAHIDQPDTTVLFTGYQAEGTLGRDLLEGAEHVRIFGEELRVAARLERLEMLSAHADYSEMLRWLRGFKEPPKHTFIVHGEPDAALAMKQHIIDELGWQNLTIPAQGDSFQLE
ncbi:MAG: MBL fold metallo-hydrolase [Armatimonadetes bacterium]|nr:MBL fold metallo-hydrolase [Armatimonadota bacterium]MBX3109185.1 MBL fold metallo-hydrolase [Fimbriimonadaceae bacterium]